MALEDIDALLCPLFTLALYFYWRFEVDREPIPDFTDRSQWNRARVFTGSEAGKPYTSDQQYRAIKRMHDKAEVRGHVCHGARISASLEDDRNRLQLRFRFV